jgi:hypothetical protein
MGTKTVTAVKIKYFFGNNLSFHCKFVDGDSAASGDRILSIPGPALLNPGNTLGQVDGILFTDVAMNCPSINPTKKLSMLMEPKHRNVRVSDVN